MARVQLGGTAATGDSWSVTLTPLDINGRPDRAAAKSFRVEATTNGTKSWLGTQLLATTTAGHDLDDMTAALRAAIDGDAAYDASAETDGTVPEDIEGMSLRAQEGRQILRPRGDAPRVVRARNRSPRRRRCSPLPRMHPAGP